MFRLAQLICVAAASTVASTEASASKDATKTQKEINSEMKSMNKKIIIGSDKILHNKFEMPYPASGDIPTYADIIAAPKDYCTQCLFSGGAWTPATKVNDKDVAAICIFSAKTLATLKKGKHDKAVPVTIDETLSYKSLFEGLDVCAGTSESEQTSTIVANVDTLMYKPNCYANYDLTIFSAGKATGKKGDVPSSFTYKWNSQTASSVHQSCFIRTVLPHKYAGGLVVTHTADADTNVAIQVRSGILNRYFNMLTLKSNSLGKSGKIGLLNVERVDVFMAQADKFVTATDATNSFKVTFTRATYIDIGLLTVQEGGVVVWVIIGVVLLCLIVCMICLWKKCTGNKADEDKFAQEDRYVRV